MPLVEFIGFLITLFLFLFFMIKQAGQEGYRPSDPKDAAKRKLDEKEAVKALLKSMNIEIKDEEEEIVPPPPIIKVVEEHIEEPIKPIKLVEKSVTSTNKKKWLFTDHSLKDAIVIKEIIGKPKSLQ